MKTARIQLVMANYIAHPYWPAKNRVIEIQKKSGYNRLKNEDKRLVAIKTECENQGCTYDQYLALIETAKAQWYTNSEGLIMIPRHQIAGSLVETIGRAPKALRGEFDKENFRALVQVGDFVTDRTEGSGLFARFVKLETSNQRSWQENEFLGQYLEAGEPFAAEGTIAFGGSPKTEQTIRALFTKAVEDTGIGAARKMGFGRGAIVKWLA